jgi:hypothetical protein
MEKIFLLVSTSRNLQLFLAGEMEEMNKKK